MHCEPLNDHSGFRSVFAVQGKEVGLPCGAALALYVVPVMGGQLWEGDMQGVGRTSSEPAWWKSLGAGLGTG